MSSRSASHWAIESYQEGPQLDAASFYSKLETGGVLPTTSQPSAGVFAEMYRTLAKTSASILSIHISSGLSGTLNSARAGAHGSPRSQGHLLRHQNPLGRIRLDGGSRRARLQGRVGQGAGPPAARENPRLNRDDLHAQGIEVPHPRRKDQPHQGAARLDVWISSRSSVWIQGRREIHPTRTGADDLRRHQEPGGDHENPAVRRRALPRPGGPRA